MADRAEVKVIPPVVLGASLAVGIAVGKLVPPRMMSPDVARPVGIVLVVAALLLAVAAVRELRRAKTAVNPRKSTSAIVATGPFRFSRNPIYLAMVLLYVGVAFLVDSPWTLLLAIVTGGLLYLIAIKPEERYLAAKFGDAYLSYCLRVRRWI